MDREGFVYVAGDTSSNDFPGAPNRGASRTDADVFVAKLTPNGQQIVWAAYLGGSGNDFSASLAIDGSGNVYVAGQTASGDLPSTPGVVQPGPQGGTDSFVAKLAGPTGATTWLTYLGGSLNDRVEALRVDSLGRPVVIGTTNSTNLPTTVGVIQPALNGTAPDIFITKLTQDGTTAVMSTYLGGSNSDFALGLALDSLDNIYASGSTASANFPGAATSTIQSVLVGNRDACLAKLTPDGATIVYSTYYGGNEVTATVGDPELEQAVVAVDGNGAAYLGGFTSAPTLPGVTTSSIRPTAGGQLDGFIAKIAISGSSVTYATFFGGNDVDIVSGIAVDRLGNVHITGQTASSAATFPLVDAIASTRSGPLDAFIARIDAAGATLQVLHLLRRLGSRHGACHHDRPGRPCLRCGTDVIARSRRVSGERRSRPRIQRSSVRRKASYYGSPLRLERGHRLLFESHAPQWTAWRRHSGLDYGHQLRTRGAG